MNKNKDEFKIPDTNMEKTVLKTIRIKYFTFKKIEELAKRNNISINRLFNECIEYALEHLKEDLK